MESIREKLTKKLTLLKDRFEGSRIYNRLRDTYQGLSPKIQKLIRYIFIFFIAWQLYSLPASYINTAHENLSFFEENRSLTKNLIRAGRIARSLPPNPPSFSKKQLRSALEGKISSQEISDEQQKGITPLNQVTDKSLFPDKVKQTGLKVKLDKLNLRQTVLLAESFDSIESSRLTNLSITADRPDPHYFNVEYEVVAFSIPSRDLEKKAGKKKSSRKKKKERKKRNKKKKENR